MKLYRTNVQNGTKERTREWVIKQQQFTAEQEKIVGMDCNDDTTQVAQTETPKIPTARRLCDAEIERTRLQVNIIEGDLP